MTSEQNTQAEQDLRGYRVLRGAINVGDYIRIANANPSMCEQWWKVTSIEETKIGHATRVNLVNAIGGFRTGYALNSWDRIIRHPYSQKRANPANYVPLED